jgi:hypothetical protein
MARSDTAPSFSTLNKAIEIISVQLNAATTWSGFLSDFSGQHSMEHAEAVALLQIVLDRCLHLFWYAHRDCIYSCILTFCGSDPESSTLASKLAELMLSCGITEPVNTKGSITAKSVFLSACRRAEFWEMAVLRGKSIRRLEIADTMT